MALRPRDHKQRNFSLLLLLSLGILKIASFAMKMLCMRRWSFLKIMDDFVSSRFSFPNKQQLFFSVKTFVSDTKKRFSRHVARINGENLLVSPCCQWSSSLAQWAGEDVDEKTKKNPFFRRKEIHRQLNKTEAEKGVWGEMALGGVKRAFLLHHNTSYFNGSEIYVSENVFLFISPHIRRRMEKKKTSRQAMTRVVW